MNFEEKSIYNSSMEICNTQAQREINSTSVSDTSSAFSVLLSVAEQMEPIPIPATPKSFILNTALSSSSGINGDAGHPKTYGYQVAVPVNSSKTNFENSLENVVGAHDINKRGPSKGYHVSLSSALPSTKTSLSTTCTPTPSSEYFYSNAFINTTNSQKKSDNQILGGNIIHNSKHVFKTFSKHSGYIAKVPSHVGTTDIETFPEISPLQLSADNNDHQKSHPYINSTNNNTSNNKNTSNNNNIIINSGGCSSENHSNGFILPPPDNHSSAEDMDEEDDPRRKRKRELSRASHARMRQQIDNKLSRVVSLLRIYREKTSKEENTKQHPEVVS